MKHSKKTLRNVERKLIAEMWYYQLRDAIESGCKIKVKDKQLMEAIREAYNLDKLSKVDDYWISCGKLAVIRWIMEDKKRYNQKGLSLLEDEFEDKFWYLTRYEKKIPNRFQKNKESRKENQEYAQKITEKYGSVGHWKNCKFEDFVICGKLAAIRWLTTGKWIHPDYYDVFEDDETSHENDPLPDLDVEDIEEELRYISRYVK